MAVGVPDNTFYDVYSFMYCGQASVLIFDIATLVQFSLD